MYRSGQAGLWSVTLPPIIMEGEQRALEYEFSLQNRWCSTSILIPWKSCGGLLPIWLPWNQGVDPYQIWMFPKIVVPPNHPLKNRVFHYMFTHPFLGETPPIFENTHILACLGSRLVSDRTDPLRLCDELHTEGRRPTVSFCWLVGFQSWEFPRDFWSFVGVLEEILHHNWLVVSNILLFSVRSLGKIPILD